MKRLASAKVRGVCLAAMLGAVLLASGCVRSKVVVTSEPSEAIVTMNGVNLGTTPLEHPFTWYWYYDFIAMKPGYETVGVRKRFRAPVYLWPGLDLLMEAMPFWVTDTKYVHIDMEAVDERPRPVFAEPSAESTS